MTTRFYLSLSFIILLPAFFSCKEDDNNNDEIDGGGDTDSDSDTDTDSDTDSDTDTDSNGGDENTISITDVYAPDRTSVVVHFNRNPELSTTSDVETYSINLGDQSLEILEVKYDATEHTATLATQKQTLGVSYLLTIFDKGEVVQDLERTFLSADTAVFWATDFSDSTFGQYEVAADRVAVGTHCVVYIEKGQTNPITDEMIDYFDEKVFPIETDLFTEAPDMDENGKILILGLDGGSYYGGYFSQVNAMDDEMTMSMWGIHSNEMEMIHLNVSSKGFVDFSYFSIVIPHEFQHLLYNAYHGSTWPYWTYHDEGLAESAVRAVNGDHDYNVGFYFSDYDGLIGDGLSLVHWTYALYENYALAYLFWSYLASQLDGVQSLGDFFRLPTGNPCETNDLIEEKLGQDFPQTQMNSLIAAWVQDESGAYSFGDMIDFPNGHPPTVSAGTTSVDLEAFAGTFFILDEQSVDIPDTAGPNIKYAGIDLNGNVTLEAPYTVTDGALLAFNSAFEDDFCTNYNDAEPLPMEHSGPDVPTSQKKTYSASIVDVPISWLNPPPLNPYDMRPVKQWQRATFKRLSK